MLFKQHLKVTSKLAIPLIISQVGHIVTGIVDTIFLGKLGVISNTAQASCVLANQLFVVLLVFAIGVSYSLTPKIASASVNCNQDKKVSLLKNAILLNFLICVILFIVLFFSTELLDYMQQPYDVTEMAKPFFKVLILSIIPLSFYFVGKQYCEGLSNTNVAMIISIIGNLINILLNYCLIFGKFGFPEMGYMGSCWATFIARCLMGMGFIAVLYYSKEFNYVGKLLKTAKINFLELKDLLYSGLAFGFQFSFEIASFLLCALMVGSIGKEELIAHGITMHLTSFTYMFGSGIGGVALIRVSNFYAKKDLKNLFLANQASFVLICIIMGIMGLIFLTFNTLLATYFSTDFHVIELTSKLLIVAGLFQLFDGIQVTAINILRGLEDYKIPTIITLISYWVIAMPLAYLFAFVLKLNAFGIWIALCISLIIIASTLFLRIRFLCFKLTSNKN